MFSKKMKLALALCASLAGGVAAAQPYEGAGAPPVQTQVQQERAARRAARKAELLAKYDLNKDGKLEPNERALMREELATKRFEKMDLNKDGVVTLDEFKQFVAQKGKMRHARGRMWRHHRRGLQKGSTEL